MTLPEYPEESRFTPARGDCPHPERWHSSDADSTELELSVFISALVQAIRPDLVIETGSAFGQTSEQIGKVLDRAGFGRLISFEIDGDRVQKSRDRVEGLPVEVRRESSLEGMEGLLDEWSGRVGVIFLDSLFDLRPLEWEPAVKLLAPGGVICVHDCGNPNGTKYPKFSKTMHDKAKASGFVGIPFNTPRGFTMFGRAV